MIRCFLAVFTAIISITVNAQLNSDSIHQRVLKYAQNYPQEKIYLHLDRPHYSPGDTIWFKAYITDAVNHLADSVSKNIYVQLIRKSNGKQVDQQMIKNTGGFSHGNISLKDTLSEGVYEIRSFTNWMRNFPEVQFFHKEIYVRKRLEFKNKYSPEELALLQVADLQFFPEGGNLIAGLQNRVAFKAVNKLGKGVEFAAFIISDHADTVAAIQSRHLGMGSFIFTPKAGEKYFARIDKSSTEHSPLQKLFYLPLALPQGYTFFVDNLSNKELIKVINRNNFLVKDRPFLIGHCRGNVIFNVPSAGEGNSFSWALKKSDIPEDGVIQLTLFNSQGVPQCERLIYNDTKSPLMITVTPGKQEYHPREKVMLSVNVKDNEGNPVQGNFSLTATDNLQVNAPKNGENIYSYFYLSSDVQALSKELKGDIEQPGYYFDKSNVDAPVYLDILLMTQGWRRFLWNDVLKTDPPTQPDVYDIETGISVRGNAKLVSGKKLKEPLNMTMMYGPEKGPKAFAAAKTDMEGNFTFQNLNVKEPTTAFIQGAKDNGSRWTNLSITQYKWPECKPSYELVDPLYSDAEQMKLYLERQKRWAEIDAELAKNKVNVLKEAIVIAKKERVIDTRKSLYEGTNVTAFEVKRESCASAVHVLQLLQGRAAGLMIKSEGAGYSATTRWGRPVYLLDGMIIDAMFLNSISPCNVQSIEVITHPVITYGANGGVISLLTKGGNPNYDWSQEEARGAVVAKIKGYEMPREFYSPKYASVEVDPKHIPDFRATLYWNQQIKTDVNGNAMVTFWNSDEKTSVRVTIEGISSKGIPGAASCGYEIH